MPDDQNEPTRTTDTTAADFSGFEQEPSVPPTATPLASEGPTSQNSTPVEQPVNQPVPEPVTTPPVEETAALTQPTTPSVDPLLPSQSAPITPNLLPLSSPTASSEPSTNPFSSPAPLVLKSSKKKGLLIGIIIAVIIVLLGGGSAFAYKFWYQNPEKVVTDAFIHAIDAKTVIYKGDIHMVGNGSNVTVAVTGRQGDGSGQLDTAVTFAVNGKNYTVNGSGLIDKSGDLYIKLAKLDDLANAAKNIYTDPQEKAAISPLVDQLKAKIDGTWIKVSSDDLKDFSDSYATTKTCLSDAVKKFKSDNAARTQLTNLYEKHQFITIEKELGAKNGSLGYNLSSDDAAAKAFANGVKDTDIYKQLHGCDSSFTINADDLTDSSSSKDNGTVTVWVSRWTHELTKVTAKGTSDGTTTDFSIEPTFNQKVTVTTPAKSTTLKQLESDITDLIESVYMSSYNSSFDESSTNSIAL